MPTPKRGARIGGSARNQRHILSNLAAALFEHDSIKTTDAKAKLLRPYAEKLITKARSGTLADRREVLAQVPQRKLLLVYSTNLLQSLKNATAATPAW